MRTCQKGISARLFHKVELGGVLRAVLQSEDKLPAGAGPVLLGLPHEHVHIARGVVGQSFRLAARRLLDDVFSTRCSAVGDAVSGPGARISRPWFPPRRNFNGINDPALTRLRACRLSTGRKNPVKLHITLTAAASIAERPRTIGPISLEGR